MLVMLGGIQGLFGHRPRPVGDASAEARQAPSASLRLLPVSCYNRMRPAGARRGAKTLHDRLHPVSVAAFDSL